MFAAKECVKESMKNNAEELLIKKSSYKIKLKRGSGKKKIHVCTCNFDPLFAKYAGAITRYADLLKREEFAVSLVIAMQLPLQFVKRLDSNYSWTELPQEIRDKMKTKVECYRKKELISMKLYPSPASSNPIFNLS